ncbi:MAG: glycerophosphodiester phosphodiesterase family protein [Bacteroidota bacterium]|nr:glycerophosphodiester phosphodiesterase family protein [Bacteroidota bacterium]
MKYLKTFRKISLSVLLISFLGFSACQNDTDDYSDLNRSETIPLKTLSVEAQQVRDLVRKDIVISHRGTTVWAPEETESAFRWARNMGGDYLEIDVQMTSDGVLLALHDGNLRRTTDIARVFPGKEDNFVNTFTLKELRQLDAGSWFNEAKPENANSSFVNEKISTLEDVIKIAEGYRIKRDADGNRVQRIETDGEWHGHYEYEIDPADNGNRPGLYIETKAPWKFPGMEEKLAEDLKSYGWLATDSPKEIATTAGKVDVANTEARIILQSFSLQSIIKLESALKGIPKCMLLWKSDMNGADVDSFADWINFSVENNCNIVGPSIGGAPNDYDNITEPWMVQMMHRAGMLVHAYSFDTEAQLKKYNGDYFYENKDSRFDNPDRAPLNELKPSRDMFIDGGFTNLTGLSLEYQNRASGKTALEILSELGY